MVLVDTSVWIDHFNHSDETVCFLLVEQNVVMHSFVLGELACGNFKNRNEIFRLLKELPVIQKISDEEYHYFLEKNKLYGIGLGFVDIHLLAASFLYRCQIYTRDKILHAAATILKVEYKK
jgi:predicted nucleic acid-binding protein